MERLYEITQAGGTVDKNILRNVKILGPKSRNGRVYTTGAVGQVADLAEGAKVYTDHSKGPRRVADLVGRISNARVEGGAVRGDLSLLKSHPLRDRILELASGGHGVGLSISAEGEVDYGQDTPVVRSIHELRSVDLVADPATAKNLYEEENIMAKDTDVQKIREEELAEQKRISEIRKIARKREKLMAKAIEEGWTPDETKLQVMFKKVEEFEENSVTPPAMHVPGRAAGSSQELHEARLLHYMGRSELVEEHFGEQVAEAAEKRPFRGWTPFAQEILAEGAIGQAELTGMSPSRIFEEAVSTRSFSNIVSNVANKTALAGYRMSASAARKISKPLTANDFKQHTGVRLTGDFVAEKVGTDGEVHHGNLSDDAYTYQVDTYAKIVGIDRRDWVNDDANVLSDVMMNLGRGAALREETVFWQMVLGNSGSFFGTGNSNYISGSETSLAHDSLALAEKTLLKQTDENGNSIDIPGKYLVVPPELSAKARSYYNSDSIIADSVAEVGGNPFHKQFEPVVVPSLSNDSYSGYSTTAWYLLADPGNVPCFGIAYLGGRRGPEVRRVDPPADRLALMWRCLHDFGVCQIDHRGGVMSKGAA